MLEVNINFPLYKDVILLRDLPDEDLYAGDIGTVVEIHQVQGIETGYSVEFFDLLGNTVGIVTLPMSNFRLPTHADRPAARLIARTA
jgi:hypothetical protein